jgi:hypothetical protein
MSEFPALRDALVAAGKRRRRRRRAVAAGIPTLAVAAAAVAFISLPSAPPEREEAAPPPAPRHDALEQAFSLFRRPQVPSDLPTDAVLRGEFERARSRLVARLGRVRVFAVPATMHGKRQLCAIEVGPSSNAAGCAPLPSGPIPADFTPGLATGKVFALILPDGTHDVVLTHYDGSKVRPPVRENGVVVSGREAVGAAAWTSASGTRYTMRNEFAPAAAAPPKTCPSHLDPLPADAVERAIGVALTKASDLYPFSDEATVKRAVRAKTTPCGPAVAGRAIVVSLDLLPRSLAVREREGPSRHRLLVGFEKGAPRVFYLLR